MYFQSCRFGEFNRPFMMTLPEMQVSASVGRETVPGPYSSGRDSSLLPAELTSSRRDTLSLSDAASTVTTVSAASSGMTETSAYHSDTSCPNSPFTSTLPDNDSQSQVGFLFYFITIFRTLYKPHSWILGLSNFIR